MAGRASQARAAKATAKEAKKELKRTRKLVADLEQAALNATKRKRAAKAASASSARPKKVVKVRVAGSPEPRRKPGRNDGVPSSQRKRLSAAVQGNPLEPSADPGIEETPASASDCSRIRGGRVICARAQLSVRNATSYSDSMRWIALAIATRSRVSRETRRMVRSAASTPSNARVQTA